MCSVISLSWLCCFPGPVVRCISHPSKVTLKIILNRPKPLAEKITAEKQTGFRARRSTTEKKKVNLRILYKNYLQHQQDLYHVFIDYKKAFDKVWHAALPEIMKKYISTNVIQVIENLYNKATSAVLFNSSMGDWFRITVGVRQGCLLSPTLFNIFLERIMTDALEHHEGTVSIGGRTITNLRYADDIGGLAGEEEELATLVERLNKASTVYGMDSSAEKTKLMTNNASGINTKIKVNRQKLGTCLLYTSDAADDC